MTTVEQPVGDGKYRPTREDVAKYRMLLPMLESLYVEVKDFSKKHPDKQVNKFRVRKINEVLTPLKELLKADSSVEYLELLSEEELPENGDAVIILGQFKAAMKQFHDKHKDRYQGWYTQEDHEAARAAQEEKRRLEEEESDFDDDGLDDEDLEEDDDLDESDRGQGE